MNPLRPQRSAEEKVLTPFGQTETTVSTSKGSGTKWLLTIVAGLLLVLVGGLAGFYLLRYVNDPYRALAPFPVSLYFENYQGLAGSKFRAQLQVENDLGWKDGGGRLMLFSTKEDPRPMAVMIPAAVASGIYFTKGQIYLVQIEVKEGGLIYADSFQKD